MVSYPVAGTYNVFPPPPDPAPSLSLWIRMMSRGTTMSRPISRSKLLRENFLSNRIELSLSSLVIAHFNRLWMGRKSLLLQLALSSSSRCASSREEYTLHYPTIVNNRDVLPIFLRNEECRATAYKVSVPCGRGKIVGM